MLSRMTNVSLAFKEYQRRKAIEKFMEKTKEENMSKN